ncbi:MazG nucleotide pyrophosphohydrolase domain-containing protein [Candidatus Hodarchaeum mangrovi]
MELQSLAKQVDDYIISHGGYWDLPWLLAAITEELGELARALQEYLNVRKIDKKRQLEFPLQLVKNECGDLLFSLFCLTNFLEIDLGKALLETLDKYSSR